MKLGEEVFEGNDAMKLVGEKVVTENNSDGLREELLSTGKKGYIESLNNPSVSRVIDETRVAKESILD